MAFLKKRQLLPCFLITSLSLRTSYLDYIFSDAMNLELVVCLTILRNWTERCSYGTETS